MNELIKMLVDQLELDDAVAKQAVEIVIGFVKDKLPNVIGDQLENILDGEDDGGVMDQIANMVEGNIQSGGGILGLILGLLTRKR